MGAGKIKSCSGVVDEEGSSNADGGLFKFVATMDKYDREEDEETFTCWRTADWLGTNPKADELKARMVTAYTRILNLFLERRLCVRRQNDFMAVSSSTFDCVVVRKIMFSLIFYESQFFFVALVSPTVSPAGSADGLE